MNRKTLSLVAFLLTLVLMMAGCGGNSGTSNVQGPEIQEVEEEDTFRVGLECGYPPFNWTQLDVYNGTVPIDWSQEYA